LNFQGTFAVNEVRHVGHFRQPTCEAWVTITNCTPNFTSSGGISSDVAGSAPTIPPLAEG